MSLYSSCVLMAALSAVGTLTPVAMDSLGTIKGKSGLSVTVEEDKGACAFPGDCLLIKVKPAQTRLGELKKSVYSSYGEFRLMLQDLTGDGLEEVIVITGSGRGTNVREETIVVYQLLPGEIREVIQQPVSAYFGTGKRWWYNPVFTTNARTGVTKMSLCYERDSWEEGDAVFLDLLPTEGDVAYVWVPGTSSFQRASEAPACPTRRSIGRRKG